MSYTITWTDRKDGPQDAHAHTLEKARLLAAVFSDVITVATIKGKDGYIETWQDGQRQS